MKEKPHSDRFDYKKPINLLGVSKYAGNGLGLWQLPARIYANPAEVRERVISFFMVFPRHKLLVRMEQFDHEDDPNGKCRAFNMIVGNGRAFRSKPTTKQGRMRSARMKALTKEAKRLRKEKPKMTWATAMKRAAKNLKPAKRIGK